MIFNDDGELIFASADEFEAHANKRTQHFGVEAIFDPNRPAELLYLYENMGDPYRAGLIWYADSGKIKTGCIGDIIEEEGL